MCLVILGGICGVQDCLLSGAKALLVFFDFLQLILNEAAVVEYILETVSPFEFCRQVGQFITVLRVSQVVSTSAYRILPAQHLPPDLVCNRNCSL